MKIAQDIYDQLKGGVSAEQVAKAIRWAEILPNQRNELLEYARMLQNDPFGYDFLRVLFVLSALDDAYSIRVLQLVLLHSSMNIANRGKLLASIERRLKRMRENLGTDTNHQREWMDLQARYYYLSALFHQENQDPKRAYGEIEKASQIFYHLGNSQALEKTRRLERQIEQKLKTKSPRTETSKEQSQEHITQNQGTAQAEYDRLLQEIKKVEKHLQELIKDLLEKEKFQAKLNQAQFEKTVLLRQLEANIKFAQAKANDLEKKVVLRQKKLREVISQGQELNNRRSELEGRLAAAQKKFDEINNQVAFAQTQLDELQKKLTAARLELENTQKMATELATGDANLSSIKQGNEAVKPKIKGLKGDVPPFLSDIG